jgi:hypothetical protein
MRRIFDTLFFRNPPTLRQGLFAVDVSGVNANPPEMRFVAVTYV